MGFPVFPLEWKAEDGTSSMGYREQGFFPEAVVNFLALLGWNDGTDKEIYSLEELIQSFDLTRVNKSGAKFDPEKNKWFNHQVLVTKTNAELASYLKPVLEAKAIQADDSKIETIIGLVKDRANLTTELFSLVDFFFVAPTEYDAKAAKNWKEDTNSLMEQVSSVIDNVANFEAKEIETTVKNWIQENELGMGKIMQPLRIAMVGEMKGPDLFEIIALLGKEEAKKRLYAAIGNFSVSVK